MKSIHLIALALACSVTGCDPGTPRAADAEASQSTAQPELATRPKHPVRFTRTDLVSDLPGAQVQDPTLVNAWGLAFNPNGIAWISANGNALAEIYDAKGASIAPARTTPDDPTGQLFNPDSKAFSGDTFILATEGGMIAGWQAEAGASFVTRVDSSSRSAVYKGLAEASFRGAMRLYAADFHNGAIDVFDSSYAPLKTAGGFVDRELPQGFAPFNVVSLQGALIVTFAKQDDAAHDDVAGRGNGFVDLFSTDGELLSRLASRDGLDSPWAVAMTPLDYGQLSNRLLIGNFGDGHINVFRLEGDDERVTATEEDQLRGADGRTLAIDGLWALGFGAGSGGFASSDLYFTAGPQGESHGVFGKLQRLNR